MSITVEIDEKLLADLGRDEVEKELAKTVERLELRRLAREAINDLVEVDLIIDSPEWQAMRQQTWKAHGHRYQPTSVTNA